MSDPLNAFRNRHDRITISTIHVAFALSLLLHALLLSGWLPKVTMRPSEKIGEGKPSGQLAVRLAPPPAPAPAPPPAPMALAAPSRSAPASRALASRSAPPPRERMLSQERPGPARAVPPAETRTAPANTDLAAFVDARRRAREPEPAQPPSTSRPPVETAQQRDNRIAAMNLGLNRTPSFGDERKHGGGIFQVARKGYDDAEFFFFGWNKAILRNSRQMIDVRRGDNPTIEIAIVRRMISIIREHEKGDFTWESQRLGRDVWLSARASDNSGLEEFLMQEFFPGMRAR